MYLITYFITICLSFPIESLLIPFLTGQLINTLSQLNNANRKKQLITVFWIFIAIIGAWIVNACAYSVMDYNDSMLIPEFSSFFRDYIIAKLYMKYENQFDEINIGVINTKLVLLPANLTEFLNVFLNFVFPRVFIVLIIMFYFFYLDYHIGGILLFGILIFFFLIKNTIFDCVNLFAKHNKFYEDINELHKDKISNLFSIYSSNKMKEEIKDNGNQNDKFKKNYRGSLQCTNKLKTISYIINILLFFFINSMVLYLFIHKKISIGGLIAVFLTVIYLLQYLMDISYWSPKLVEYYGIIKNSEDFLNDLDSITQDDKPPIKINSGKIQFNRVFFDYDNKPLFKGLNLTIPSNTKICILGKSGSGKSTLVKLIMGYYPVKTGSILIDGQNIGDFNVNSIRQNISYIHQNVVLFNKSIYENIIYGQDISKQNKSKKSREDINNLIKSMGLESVFKNLKDGIDTVVGVDGNKLSGGQKQITFILREIVSDKKIIILDEPTSALDAENKQIILQFIKKIVNKTVIIITHDDDFVKYVDTAYLLKDGSLMPI